MSLAPRPPIPRSSISEATLPSFGFVTVVAGIAVVAAVFVLVIWLARLDGVMRLLPSTALVKANGALALLLGAAALLLEHGWLVAGPRRLAAQLLALGCLVIAGATTLEWFSGVNLGIDQAMVRDWTADSIFPGRPTVIGSTALTLIAIGILAGATSARLGRIRDGSVLAVIALGVVSIAGLLTGVAGFSSGNEVAPASLFTAMGVTFCGVGVLVTGHSHTVGLLLRRGPAGSLARGLTVASVTAPLALGAVATEAERTGIVGAHVAIAFVVAGTILLGAVMAMVAARSTGCHMEEIASAGNAPRMDGREAIARIRSEPTLRTLPVVVLTTSDAREDVENAYALGANSYIVKPVSFDGLVRLLAELGRYWLEVVQLPPAPLQ